MRLPKLEKIMDVSRLHGAGSFLAKPLPQKSIDVSIVTKNLYLRPINETDIGAYQRLCCSEKLVDQKIQTWIQHWRDGDPFSSLAVLKNNELIGHITLDHSGTPGEAELSFNFFQHVWNQGLDAEAMSAVLEHYAYKLMERKIELDTQPFSITYCKVDVNDVAKNKIMHQFMQTLGQRSSDTGTKNLYGRLFVSPESFWLIEMICKIVSKLLGRQSFAKPGISIKWVDRQVKATPENYNKITPDEVAPEITPKNQEDWSTYYARLSANDLFA